jgi:hypothetical protein
LITLAGMNTSGMKQGRRAGAECSPLEVGIVLLAQLTVCIVLSKGTATPQAVCLRHVVHQVPGRESGSRRFSPVGWLTSTWL